jgi:hypothetical protein
VHPINLSSNHDFNDPVKVYTMSAEAECRRGMISSNGTTSRYPVIKSFVEFNYIENVRLQELFEVRLLLTCYWSSKYKKLKLCVSVWVLVCPL